MQKKRPNGQNKGHAFKKVIIATLVEGIKNGICRYKVWAYDAGEFLQHSSRYTELRYNGRYT
jgi:hypothetical protein